MKFKHLIILAIFCTVCVISCTKNNDEVPAAAGKNEPLLPEESYNYLSDPLFANTGNLSFAALNSNVVTLGRVLFYDKKLSFNNNISCGSCHIQQKGFADNVRFHKGVFGNSLKRNTLAVSGNSPNLFWDGRSGSIMDLVLKPVANHEEMVQDPNVLLVKLKQNEYYPELFRKAYGNMDINLRAIENALAAFCFALAPNNSKFDVALLNALNTSNGFFNDDSSLSFGLFNASENNGLKLFFGKARCGTCHHPEQQGGSYGSPIQTAAFANIGLDMVYADNGLGALDQQKTNNGKFKIPNLKNVALTAPYMHDGRFNTLEEVIEHYNSRVLPNLNLSPKLFNKALTTEEIEMLDFQGFNPFTGPVLPVSLNLSNDEKADLLAFLKTLTDEDLVNDIKFSDPFPR